MSALKFNVRDAAANLGMRAHVALTTHYSRLANKQWEHPWQHGLMKTTAGITVLGLCVTSAHADGLADLVSHGADQGDAIKGYGGRLFAAIGFLLAAYGGFNWWKHGKEGEQTQVKAKQIYGPILGGMALGATGYLLVKAGETIGVAGSSQGALPN